MKNYPLIGLLKFGDEQHLKQLQEGKVYFNTMQFFRDYEEKHSDTVIGDKSEGNFDFYADFVELRNPADNSIIAIIKNCSVPLPVSKNPCNMACFYAIYECDKEKKISKEEKEKLEKFGGHVLLITKPDLFFQKLDTELNRLGYHGERGSVSYYEEGKNVKQHIESFQSKPENALFRKSELYSYQREYRYVLDGKSNDPVFVEIGNIADFTQLFQISLLFEAVK